MFCLPCPNIQTQAGPTNSPPRPPIAANGSSSSDGTITEISYHHKTCPHAPITWLVPRTQTRPTCSRSGTLGRTCFPSPRPTGNKCVCSRSGATRAKCKGGWVAIAIFFYLLLVQRTTRISFPPLSALARYPACRGSRCPQARVLQPDATDVVDQPRQRLHCVPVAAGPRHHGGTGPSRRSGHVGVVVPGAPSGQVPVCPSGDVRGDRSDQSCRETMGARYDGGAQDLGAYRDKGDGKGWESAGAIRVVVVVVVVIVKLSLL
ncbi:hypothetical protein BC828DRAFT_378148 [Blastocladiella britannica]|nr:hypothetical protein BC828DRAFT_378148 [Blastocladiella britannica]